jgi:hypothetical protein
MGFTQFWQVASFASSQHNLCALSEPCELEFHSEAKRPWVVIDWNNFVMRSAISNGGSPAIASIFFDRLFASILHSGARICIVRDGGFDEQRLLIKMKRVYDDLIQTLDPSQSSYYQSDDMKEIAKFSMKSKELVRSTVYSNAWRILQSFASSSSSFSNDIDNDLVDNISHKAKEEADDAIRAFCRRKLAHGDKVFVLSGDASLILDVVPPERLYMVEISSLTVDPLSQKIICKKVNVGNIIRRLNVLSNMLCTIPGEITAQHIPTALALIDCEASRAYTENQYFDPLRIVEFLKEYFAPKKKIGSRKLDMFLAAVVVSKALLHRLQQPFVNSYPVSTMAAPLATDCAFPIPPGAFRHLIDDVVQVAENLVSSGQIGPASVAGFTPHRNVILPHLANLARNILQHSEIKSNIPVSKVQSVIRQDSEHIGSMRQQKLQHAEVRFLSSQGWFPASVRIIGQPSSTVTYAVVYDPILSSSISGEPVVEMPKYNQPCGLRSNLAREHVTREICQRIALSSFAMKKTGEVSCKASHQLWSKLQFGTWCTGEHLTQTTEMTLLPLISLVRQLQFVLDDAIPWATASLGGSGSDRALSDELFHNEEYVKWKSWLKSCDEESSNFEKWMSELKDLVLRLDDESYLLSNPSHSQLSNTASDTACDIYKTESDFDYDSYYIDYDENSLTVATSSASALSAAASTASPAAATSINSPSATLSKRKHVSPYRPRELMTSKIVIGALTYPGCAIHDFTQLYEHFSLPPTNSCEFSGNPIMRHGFDIFEHSSEAVAANGAQDQFGIVVVNDVVALNTPPESAEIEIKKVVGLWCGYVKDDPGNVYFSRYKNYSLRASNDSNTQGILLDGRTRLAFFKSLLLDSLSNENSSATISELFLRRKVVSVLNSFREPRGYCLASELSNQMAQLSVGDTINTELMPSLQEKAISAIEKYLASITAIFSRSAIDVEHFVPATMIFSILYSLRHMCLPPIGNSSSSSAFALRVAQSKYRTREQMMERWTAALLWTPFFTQSILQQFISETTGNSVAVDELSNWMQQMCQRHVTNFFEEKWTEWLPNTAYQVDLIDIISSNISSVAARWLDHYLSRSANPNVSANSLNRLKEIVRNVLRESLDWYSSLGFALAFQSMENVGVQLSAAETVDEISSGDESDSNDVKNSMELWMNRFIPESFERKQIANLWNIAVREVLVAFPL